ncbi:MAG: hypothetical protein KQH67_04590 [Bacteroidetes bacterium]|nr:hypothetical protein [Bacteroidota bacterium]
MKRSIIIIGLLLGTYALSAQFAEDALRYSQRYYQGSARFMGTGGAFGALGGDFSTLSTNPGGIGVFRTGEFIITPSVASRKVSSLYLFDNTVSEDNRTVFALNNFGYVNSKRIGRGANGWKYFQYAFGMNRLNNYNSSSYTEGYNSESSKMDIYYEDAANVMNLDEYYSAPHADFDNSIGYLEYDRPFDLWPAWYTYLLDSVQGNDGYTYLVSPMPWGGEVLQTERIETRGSNNEWFASAGANLSDILYVGATLGLPYIRYYKETTYTETDIYDSLPDLNSWSITENLETKGMGVNLKIGAIVRPVDWLRIGAAYHTPTYYWSLNDTWQTSVRSDVYAISAGSWGNYQENSVIGEYKYKLTTPMRFIGDIGIVIGKYGFISGEYEYVDYSNAKFKARDYGFASENETIENAYTSTHNFRAGTEWRLGGVSLRAGYALYGSPYTDNINDGSRSSYSGGIGYRTNSFAVDFAYVYSKMNEDYYMYSYAIDNVDVSPKVDNEITENSFILTLRYLLK